MFKNIAKKSLLLALALPMAAQAQSKMSLEDRVTELESNASLNYFKFGGFLETYYDSYVYKLGTVEDNNSLMRMRVGFDINADVSKAIKFYSRISASKFLNQIGTQSGTGANAPAATSEGRQGRDWSGSQLYLEKAYADVSLTPSTIFSFGRLPTEDGPPANWNLDKPRMGTYPMVIYNSVLDGFALTHNMKFDADTLALRLIYTPLMTVAKSGSNTIASPQGDGKNDSTTHLTSWMVDYNMNGGSFAKNLSVIYQGVNSGYIWINGSTLAYPPSSTGATAFSIMSHTLNVFAEDIAGSGFDFGVAYLSTELKNKGTLLLAGVLPSYGYGAESLEDTARGSSTLAHLRYNFGNSAVGVEYVNGTKNVFIYDLGNTNLTNFYGTPGDATQVYVTHRFMPELTGRIGYAQQNYKYNDISLGKTAESDKKITTTSAMLRLDF